MKMFKKRKANLQKPKQGTPYYVAMHQRQKAQTAFMVSARSFTRLESRRCSEDTMNEIRQMDSKELVLKEGKILVEGIC